MASMSLAELAPPIKGFTVSFSIRKAEKMTNPATAIPKYPSKKFHPNAMPRIAETMTDKVAKVSVKLSIAVAFNEGEEIVLASDKFQGLESNRNGQDDDDGPRIRHDIPVD